MGYDISFNDTNEYIQAGGWRMRSAVYVNGDISPGIDPIGIS